MLYTGTLQSPLIASDRFTSSFCCQNVQEEKLMTQDKKRER